MNKLVYLTEEEQKHIEDLRTRKEEIQRLKRENCGLKRPTINIGTYPPEIADMIMKQLQGLRHNKNLYTSARVNRIRRKGRGKRVFHTDGCKRTYHDGLPLDMAEEIAIYIDMEVKPWWERIEEKKQEKPSK